MWKDKGFWKCVQLHLALFVAVALITDITITLLHSNPVSMVEVLFAFVCASTVYFDDAASKCP